MPDLGSLVLRADHWRVTPLATPGPIERVSPVCVPGFERNWFLAPFLGTFPRARRLPRVGTRAKLGQICRSRAPTENIAQ